MGHPERPVESLEAWPSCATVTQIGHGCYLRSPQERAVLCVYPSGSTIYPKFPMEADRRMLGIRGRGFVLLPL